MRKNIYLLFGLTILSATTSAQSLRLLDFKGEDISNGNIVVNGPHDVDQVAARANLTNIGSQSLNIKIKATNVNLLDGQTYQLCWLLCYNFNVSPTPDPLPINPGDTLSDFRGYLNPNLITGTSNITYVFYDMDNPDDSVSINVQYIITDQTSVNEFVSEKNLGIQKVFPNPTTDFINVVHNLDNTQNARIDFFDLAGKQVKSVSLQNSSAGLMRIDVRDLKEGVYFYSLVVNNKRQQTKKLVVNR